MQPADAPVALSVRRLSKTFPVRGGPLFGAKQVVQAVSEVSFDIRPGVACRMCLLHS